jgi:hypothetical protein
MWWNFCGMLPLYQAGMPPLYHYCGMLPALPSIVGCALPLLWDASCFTKHCGMRFTITVGCFLLHQALWDASALPITVGCFRITDLGTLRVKT